MADSESEHPSNGASAPNAGTEHVGSAAESPFQLLLRLLPSGRWRTPASVALLTALAIFATFVALPDEIKIALFRATLSNETRYIEGASYVGLAIDQNTQLIDLRNWTPPQRLDDKDCCKVTWDYRATVRRLSEDTEYFSHRVATTGMEPKFTSETHQVRHMLDDRGRSGGPTMKRYDALLDISDEPLDQPFDMHLRTVRYGAFSDTEAEWLATPIVNATKHVEITVKFPLTKPARNLRFSLSPRISNRNYAPLDVSPEHLRIADHELVWVIDNPEVGYVYRVDWDW